MLKSKRHKISDTHLLNLHSLQGISNLCLHIPNLRALRGTVTQTITQNITIILKALKKHLLSFTQLAFCFHYYTSSKNSQQERSFFFFFFSLWVFCFVLFSESKQRICRKEILKQNLYQGGNKVCGEEGKKKHTCRIVNEE